MYDQHRIPVPTAPLTADLLAEMPDGYRALHADYLATVKALNDADDIVADAESAEGIHKAEILAAAKAGKKIPAAIPPEVFAGKLANSLEARNAAYKAARRAAAALDDALKVTLDSPNDALGRIAASFTVTQLADALDAERDALAAARVATAARENALNAIQYLLIVQDVGAATDAPGTVRFGNKAERARRLFSVATVDPNWELTRNNPSESEAYSALEYSADLAHKALLTVAPTHGGDDVPERVKALKAASWSRYTADVRAAEHLRAMAGDR